MPVPEFFEDGRRTIDAALERLLPSASTPPLSPEAGRIFAPDSPAALPALSTVACAVEFIHTYSLIHDDLPGLDNDGLRPGLPTCHKQFGESLATLAGDALLTRAFEILATANLEPARTVRIIKEIATAAGTVDGMVGGQVADLQAEGHPIEPAMLEYIHRSKTAALIRAAIVCGALAGGAADAGAQRLRHFGENIGLAFQVVDDILDVEESSAALGKTAGKDQSQKKATYPALYGVESSRATARRLLADAHADLLPSGDRASGLRQLADFLVSRRA